MAINLSNKLRKSSSQNNTAKCENRNWKSDFLCALTLTICGSVEYLCFFRFCLQLPLWLFKRGGESQKKTRQTKQEASSGSGSKNKNEWKKAHTLYHTSNVANFDIQHKSLYFYYIHRRVGCFVLDWSLISKWDRKKRKPVLLWNWNW